MRRSTVLLFILGMSACGTVQAPAPARMPDADRPNIVVVLVDDLRFDEFHAGGHPYLETPNIDRLASEGALFVNAFHAVPLCSPNRASLLTGQYPSRHGIIDNVSRDLASHHLETFNIPLQRAGTGADIAHMVVFLCSDQAAWVTGQTLYVDGGHGHAPRG